MTAVAYFIFWLSERESKNPDSSAFCRTRSALCNKEDQISFILPLLSALLATLLGRLFGFLGVFDKFHSAEYSTLYAITRLMALRITILSIFIISTLNHKTSLFSERQNKNECWEAILGRVRKFDNFRGIANFGESVMSGVLIPKKVKIGKL